MHHPTQKTLMVTSAGGFSTINLTQQRDTQLLPEMQ